MRDKHGVSALLESVADGRELDWVALEAAARTPEDERLVRNLRLVARVADLHRTLPIRPVDPSHTDGGPDADTTCPYIDRWGHLEVLDSIGSGAFGDVYAARDPQLQAVVALKLLRPSAKGRLQERLLEEARALARVRHRNVVTVYGADVHDGRAGLWMERLTGRTLQAWVRAHGVLGEDECRGIAVALCSALAAVHAAGVVHGDVKAENVMREEGGRIVLMDFGSGHLQGGVGPRTGTPLYLAPEVLAGAPATRQSDIYSVGVVLFHLLTGRYPYSAEEIDQLRNAHAECARVYLRDLRPDLAPNFVHVLERALEADPAKRYASAGEMEREISGARDRPTRIPSWLFGAVAAAVALVAIAFAAWNTLTPGPVSRSVAVLPIIGADEQEHLAVRGLAGELSRELQRFDLVVKSAWNTRGVVTGDAWARLQVENLVLGEVARDRPRQLRVTLVRTADAGRWWARDYSIEIAAAPSLPPVIAADVGAALGATLRPAGRTVTHRPSPQAYDAYLKGRVLWEERSEASLWRAIEYFKHAATLDPQYADAWAGIADAYIALGVAAFGRLTPREARIEAQAAANRALELDPDSAAAQTSRAFMKFFQDWEWAAAEAGFKRALELNPQYPTAHHWYADFLNAMGRQEEAMRAIERARDLAPHSIIIHRDVAWPLFFQGRYDESIAHLDETLRMDPQYTAALHLRARALAERGRYQEAMEELRRADPNGTSATILSFRAYVEAKSSDQPAAERTLKEVEARGRDSKQFVPPYYIALVNVALGRKAKALDDLERAYREQDPTLVNVRVDPRFTGLHSEPRYHALIARMGLPSVPR